MCELSASCDHVSQVDKNHPTHMNVVSRRKKVLLNPFKRYPHNSYNHKGERECGLRAGKSHIISIREAAKLPLDKHIYMSCE